MPWNIVVDSKRNILTSPSRPSTPGTTLSPWSTPRACSTRRIWTVRSDPSTEKLPEAISSPTSKVSVCCLSWLSSGLSDRLFLVVLELAVVRRVQLLKRRISESDSLEGKAVTLQQKIAEAEHKMNSL